MNPKTGNLESAAASEEVEFSRMYEEMARRLSCSGKPDKARRRQ